MNVSFFVCQQGTIQIRVRHIGRAYKVWTNMVPGCRIVRTIESQSSERSRFQNECLPKRIHGNMQTNATVR